MPAGSYDLTKERERKRKIEEKKKKEREAREAAAKPSYASRNLSENLQTLVPRGGGSPLRTSGQAMKREISEEAAAKKEMEAQQQEELQSIIAEESPVQRDLTGGYEKTPMEKIPVLGGLISAVGGGILEKLNRRRIAKGKEPYNIAGIGAEKLRNEALTQIEADVYAEGTTASEKFGAIVEGIPIVGSLVSKYARGLIETPSGNIQTLKTTLRTERSRASKYETWAAQGIIPSGVAQQNIEDIELNVQRLESRIRMLTQISPELKFNSDEVNKIEVEILRTKEVVLGAKARVMVGLAQVATDEELDLALEDYE